MKEIIYIDTDLLHSYLAQSNGGLILETSNERGEEAKDISEKQAGYRSRTALDTKFKTGNFEIPLFLKTPEGEIAVKIEPGKHSSEKIAISQTESGKEIISKQLHDNALEDFIKENDFKSKCEKSGELVKIVDSFNIIDFNYLLKILQPDTLIDFMMKEYEDELHKLKESLKTAEGTSAEKQQMRRDLRSLEQEFTRTKDTQIKEFQYTEKTLMYLNDILPTESFLLMKNILTPLKNKFLRESAKELMFKYGRGKDNIKVTLIGKTTSIVDNVEVPNFNGNNFLFEIPNVLNSVFGPLGILKKGDCIISPIAIYFE
ncbi:DUF6414 family protein [Bacillus velezensis]|uniref:DUF6414 family protein n=1 Tax=Bacillus velezensis TaxID=492670 RepID=UPI00255B907C|nr:hypothetical protein [Bacillus velezensis]MDL5023339.1 hypothetical protein [Bacillus velezensis]